MARVRAGGRADACMQAHLVCEVDVALHHHGLRRQAEGGVGEGDDITWSAVIKSCPASVLVAKRWVNPRSLPALHAS